MRYFFLLVFFSSFVYGQKYPNVKLGRSEAVPRGLCKPSISINRADPQNLTAGAILDQVFYSNDTGRTWQRDTLTSSYGVWGDPVLISITREISTFFTFGSHRKELEQCRNTGPHCVPKKYRWR
ncbi:MAG: hypothetical protein U5L96_12155 [Owenweeksia sp.]|nr:hypothetical protein [Owenweeksia sp.]